MDSPKNNNFQQKKSKKVQEGKSRPRTNREREWKLNDLLRYYNRFNC